MRVVGSCQSRRFSQQNVFSDGPNRVCICPYAPVNRVQALNSRSIQGTAVATFAKRFVVRAALFDLLSVPQVCFTQECQANADRTFAIAIAVPLLASAGIVAYLLRPPPQELKESGQVFEDEATGFLFEAPKGGMEPERDKDGKLAFRPISYTPWPVPSDYEGERLRIDVGPIASRVPRTFVFNKVLPQPSEIVTVTLPRPMGVVFEYDAATKRAIVAGVVEGSDAEQRRKVAGLNPNLAKQSLQDGDVLRGVTCTNFVYPTKALFGAVPPQRHVVVYGADKQAWGNIRGALRKGEPKDGPVTMILERRVYNDS